MDDLEDQIMNLSSKEQYPSATLQAAFLKGHRDAKIAAADLVTRAKESAQDVVDSYSVADDAFRKAISAALGSTIAGLLAGIFFVAASTSHPFWIAAFTLAGAIAGIAGAARILGGR